MSDTRVSVNEEAGMSEDMPKIRKVGQDWSCGSCGMHDGDGTCRFCYGENLGHQTEIQDQWVCENWVPVSRMDRERWRKEGICYQENVLGKSQ